LKENAESLDLLGWLLLLGKRYEESEQMLLHALRVDPQNAAAHLHLGLLYLERDKRDLAYPQFVNARDLGNTEAQAILNQYFP
jgi:Flp pilus assembly protein TadD